MTVVAETKKDWSKQREKRRLERRGVCTFVWRTELVRRGARPPRRVNSSSPLQCAKALGEGERSQNRHYRPEKEGGVKGDFAPAEDRADGCDVI